MSPAFLTVFNLFMSFMKEKIRRRVSQQYNMTIFWDVRQCPFETFADVSKDQIAIILGLVQPEDEANTVVRNVGVYYQLTLHYLTEGLNVHSYRCEALKSRK
jgi:hypothetical protein